MRLVADKETLQRLLVNDPTVTDILVLAGATLQPPPPHCHDVVAALCSSTHVERLHLGLHIFQPSIVEQQHQQVSAAAVEQVVQWMTDGAQRSPALTVVHLSSDGWNNGGREAASSVLPHFLQGIIRRAQYGNDPLTKLSLSLLDVGATDLATLLQDGQLLELEMRYCAIRHGQDNNSLLRTERQAAFHVAQAFAANVSLTTLTLDVTDTNQLLFIAVLGALQSHPTLATLRLCHHASTAQLPYSIVHAMVKLFKSSTIPLRHVQFCDFVWTTEFMTPIAESILTSTMPITQLSIRDGRMDESACRALQRLFSNTSNVSGGTTTTSSLCSLQLSHHLDLPKRHGYHAMYDLVASSRGLHQLILSGSELRTSCFRAILRGLVSPSCAVQELVLMGELYHVHLVALLQAMPYFVSVTSMTLDLEDTRDRYKNRIVQAFGRNRSLLESHLIDDDGLLDATSRARIQVYHDRNRHFPATLQAAQTLGDESLENGGSSLLPHLFVASAPTVVVSDVIGALLLQKSGIDGFDNYRGIDGLIVAGQKRTLETVSAECEPCNKRCKR